MSVVLRASSRPVKSSKSVTVPVTGVVTSTLGVLSTASGGAFPQPPAKSTAKQRTAKAHWGFAVKRAWKTEATLGGRKTAFILAPRERADDTCQIETDWSVLLFLFEDPRRSSGNVQIIPFPAKSNE